MGISTSRWNRIFQKYYFSKNHGQNTVTGRDVVPTSLIFSAAKTLERLRQRRRAGSEDGPQVLSRIYEVGNGLALTLTLSPRRGKQVWPLWDESLTSERRAALESVSLSPGAEHVPYLFRWTPWGWRFPEKNGQNSAVF